MFSISSPKARSARGPLDRVSQGAEDQPPFQAVLRQVVLGAGFERLQGEVVHVKAGEHHDGHARIALEHLAERLQPGSLGQSQVEQDRVQPTLPQLRQAASKPRGVLKANRGVRDLGQGLAHEAHVVRIVLD